MDKDLEKILKKGLLEGYVGKSVRGSVDRAGFKAETSDYSGPEGKYHDEWIASSNGGGQELVETSGGKRGTRVYAGGTLTEEKLKSLGLTEKEVIGKLIYFVNKLEGNTRLGSDAEASEGDWDYSYRVLKHVEEIPVDVGEEEIKFKGNLVFVHFHVISPVK